MSTADRVQHLVAPLLEAAGLDLYDLELAGGVLRVLVDKEGGADIDAVAKLARALSNALDEHDPIDGHYTLEVSTPGLAAARRGALRVVTPRHTVRGRSLDASSELTWKNTLSGQACRRTASTQLVPTLDHNRAHTG